MVWDEWIGRHGSEAIQRVTGKGKFYMQQPLQLTFDSSTTEFKKSKTVD